MREESFDFLRRYLLRETGLNLPHDKLYLAESRLRTLARDYGDDGVDGVVSALKREPRGPLGQAVVDAMMTNETLFFRDQKPFELLRDVILPRLDARRPAGQPLRLWSAAASTGQEAYSIAMLVDEMGLTARGRRVAILGTDISAEAIRRASLGEYSQFEVQRGLSTPRLLRYFSQRDGRWVIDQRLRAMVCFRRGNLFDPAGPEPVHDVIFCRNLLIYFDAVEKSAALATLAARIAPDGYLILGGAESAHGLTDAFKIDEENRGAWRPLTSAERAAPRQRLAARA